MISVKLSGGLGNQFFQYAAAISQVDKNEPIHIEYKAKTNDDHADRSLTITKFNIPQNYVLDTLGTYDKQHFFSRAIAKIGRLLLTVFCHNDEYGVKKANKWRFWFGNQFGYCIQSGQAYYIPAPKKNMYFTGMWHSTIYTDKIYDYLRSVYHVKEEFIGDKTQNRIEAVKKENSVCVHVRHGDYLTATGYDVCSKQYYTEGIRVLKEKLDNPVFYVFSDDIEWCKENLKFDNVVFNEDNLNDYEDFEIMRSCKHFIISNSTFSWWAAYLGEEKSKQVVTPKEWFANRPKQQMNLPGWIEIER